MKIAVPDFPRMRNADWPNQVTRSCNHLFSSTAETAIVVPPRVRNVVPPGRPVNTLSTTVDSHVRRVR